jgi:thiol-disulfide isomerase/thioredoxin
LTPKRGVPATLVGALLILTFLLGLTFIPPLFTPRRFSFEPARSVNPPAEFSLDQTLAVVFPCSLLKGSPAQTTLRETLAVSKGGLIINFWATWCPPCLDELPSLEYLNRELEKVAVPRLPRLITISVDEKPEEIFKLFKSLHFPATLTVLSDKAGDFSRRVGTTKFPETYWINSNGKLIYKWVGPQNWLAENIVQKLRELAATP